MSRRVHPGAGAILVDQSSTGAGAWVAVDGARFALEIALSTGGTGTVVLQGTNDPDSTAPAATNVITVVSTAALRGLSTGVQPFNRVRAQVTALSTGDTVSAYLAMTD